MEGGQARVLIHAPGENQWAGERLAERIERWTGTTLPVSLEPLPPGDKTLVSVGTPQSSAVVQAVLDQDSRLGELGEEGYILKVGQWNGRDVLVAAGVTLAGANNAVSELVSWKLQLTDGGASVPLDLDDADWPAMKYRLLWSWDGHHNWCDTIEEMEAIEHPIYGTTVVPYTVEGFLTHFKKAVDFAADHKLNGYIVWGFVRDEHGGVAASQELSLYAKRQNVRILPGVATEVAYGGFTYSPNSIYNFDVWSALHPELRPMHPHAGYVAGICPSKPQNQQWLRDATEWFLQTFPDIGGVNIENGDLMYCVTDDCLANKALPENDPNFFWDQMATYTPVLEKMAELRPDLWATFATYVGFTETLIRSDLEAAVQSGFGSAVVYPPRMLQQLPGTGICQWTLTDMDTASTWPFGTPLPPSNPSNHIGLLHHGSIFGDPIDPLRWWAAPGGRSDDFSTILPSIALRAPNSGLMGLVLKGQTGAASPANELNYIAAEYFTWHPERTYAEFIGDRLTICYGGQTRAELFLTLLRNTSSNPADIRADRQLAAVTAFDPDLDVRQRTRWGNLADELNRRLNLIAETMCGNGIDDDEDGLVDCDDPDCGMCVDVQPEGLQDAYVAPGINHIDVNAPYMMWGQWNGSVSSVSMHTLPAASPGDIVSATLRIPRPDVMFTGAPYPELDLSILTVHIDAVDDTTVTLADGSSPSLGTLGVYRPPGPYVQDYNRIVELDVLSAVQADYAASRATFAWRFETEATNGPGPNIRYAPSVDNADAAFPLHGAVLSLRVGESSCTDGIDNDGDGYIDCGDSDCADKWPCRPAHPDFDNDGDVDQEDFGHLQACFTESPFDPITPECEDADVTYDSHVDQDDFGVFQSCFSGADVPYVAGCQE